MGNRVFCATDGVVHIVLEGEQTLDGLDWAFEDARAKLAARKPSATATLVDASHASLSVEHTRRLDALSARLPCRRVALVRPGWLAATLGNRRLAPATRNRVRWTRDAQAARAWIEEPRPTASAARTAAAS